MVSKNKIGIGVIAVFVLAFLYIGIMYIGYSTYVPELCPKTDKIDILYFTDYSKGAIDLKIEYIFNLSDPNPVTIRDICLPNSFGKCKDVKPNFLQIIGLQPINSTKNLCAVNSTGGYENCTLVVDDFLLRHFHDWKIVENYKIEGLAVVLCDSEEILKGEGHIVNYFEGGLSLARFI